MSTPHKCPICEGKRKLEVPGDCDSFTDCAVCDGKGVLWSPDEPAHQMPVTPDPYAVPYSPYGWPYAIPPTGWLYTPVLCRHPTERVSS